MNISSLIEALPGGLIASARTFSNALGHLRGVKLRGKVMAISAAALLGFTGAAHATTYTYNVDFTVGSVTITGTIQTDCDNDCYLGTVNTLDSSSGAGNVVSWSLTDGTSTLSSSGSLATTHGPNNIFAGSGLFIEATPTGIVDNDVTGGQNTYGLTFQTYGQPYYDIEFYNSATNGNAIYVDLPGDSTSTTFSGPETIATMAVAATPEPSSLFLLGTGLVAGASSLIRRRKLEA